MKGKSSLKSRGRWTAVRRAATKERGTTMDRIRRKELRPRCLKRQRDVLCDVMLAAGTCETWLTLSELSRLTGYGEASVSAQLRHLRKPQYGSFVVVKRLRAAAALVCNVELGPIWEYRLSRSVRAVRVSSGVAAGLVPPGDGQPASESANAG